MANKKIKRKNKKINFPTKIILDYLKETSTNLLDLTFNIFFDPDEMLKSAGFYVKNPSVASSVNRWLSNLDNFSSFERKNGKVYLTEKGRIKIIRSIIKDINISQKWDGKWRAIIFDIPEASKRERNFLRTELKYMKFKELQKSIWITPFNIENELFALLKLWKMDFEGDIRFLEINKIENDSDIKKCFKL